MRYLPDVATAADSDNGDGSGTAKELEEEEAAGPGLCNAPPPLLFSTSPRGLTIHSGGTVAIAKA